MEKRPAWSIQFTRPRAQPGTGVGSGAICLAEPPAGMRALVLVLETFGEGTRYARYCLLSNETEMQTETDCILDGAETGLPFQLMAECDLVGCIEVERLSVFGSVRRSTLDRVRDYESARREGRWGLPYHQGPMDPRWRWKLGQLAVLRRMSSGAYAELVEGEESDLEHRAP